MQAYKQKEGVKSCWFSLVNNSKEFVFVFLISYANQPLQNQSFIERKR